MWLDIYVIYLAFGLSIILSLVIFGLSYFLVPKELDIEKISAYECGFDPFEESREKFEVHFYLVSILFVIFDLEIAFLFPWGMALKKIQWFGYITMLYFLFILTVGFLYEWRKGALEWE